MLSTNQTNPFCNSWAQQLRSGHNFNALQLKKAINEKKHKVSANKQQRIKGHGGISTNVYRLGC